MIKGYFVKITPLFIFFPNKDKSTDDSGTGSASQCKSLLLLLRSEICRSAQVLGLLFLVPVHNNIEERPICGLQKIF